MPRPNAPIRSLAMFLLALCLLSGRAAAGSWPTYSYAPIPFDGRSVQSVLSDGLAPYAEGAEFFSGLSGEERGLVFDSTLEIDGLNTAEMKKGAIGPLSEAMRLLALDSYTLDEGGFPAPNFAPVLKISETGEFAYPVFWSTIAAPAQYGCMTIYQRGNKKLDVYLDLGGNLRVMQVNAVGPAKIADFSYQALATDKGAGNVMQSERLRTLSIKLLHEVVHASQASGFAAGKCGSTGTGRAWLYEGMADGVAHYVASKRYENLFEIDIRTRNSRRFDIALGDESVPAGQLEDLQYDTGAFFRYLMEATESGRNLGLSIVADILKMPPQSARSDNGIYGEIEKAIKAVTKDRTLYEVLPEFMTEYASYGEGRYKSGPGGGVDPEAWHDFAFNDCVEFEISPGVSRVKAVEIKAMAAECVHVKWSGFTQPVGMQLFVMDARDQQGDLHLGQSFKDAAGERKFCYHATRKMTPRLGRDSEDKCILSAEPQNVDGASGEFRSIQWTTDFNMTGDGEVFFVLTNVAKDFRRTKDASVKLLVGADDMKKNGGPPVRPVKKRSGSVVDDGMTDLDSRIHALATVEGGYAVDGRFVSGDPKAWRPDAELEAPIPPGGGAMTHVIAGNYMVGFVANGRSKPMEADGVVVIKDPDMKRPIGSMFGMNAPIMSPGVLGFDFNKCGFDIASDVTVLEETAEQFKFRVRADLFDMSRAMGVQDLCQGLRAAHVEFADFTVTLPFGAIYSGESRTKAASPPGREIYRRNFRDGPNYGGIDTALSNGRSAGSSEDEADPERDGAPDDGRLGTGGGSAGLAACDCLCVGPSGETGSCARDCQIFAAAACVVDGGRAAPDLIGQMKELTRLIAPQSLPRSAGLMLIEDFKSMSASTRAAALEAIHTGE